MVLSAYLHQGLGTECLHQHLALAEALLLLSDPAVRRRATVFDLSVNTCTSFIA